MRSTMRIDPNRQPEACNKCGSMFVRTEHQVRQGYKQCLPCKAEAKQEQLARRAAAGSQPKPRSAEQRRMYEASRAAKPEVRARRAADMARYARDPERRLRHEARWKARRAIASGALVRLPCETCAHESTQAHHDDYGKPLDVRWLCAACHREWHKHNTPIYPQPTRLASSGGA